MKLSFPIPEGYDLRSSLRCLSMAGKDPTRLRLPNGGARKVCWVCDQLCRLTIGANQTKVVVNIEGANLQEAEIRALLALDDCPDVPLIPDDPLWRLPTRIRRFRLGRVPWVYEAVVQTILHQRVSGSEAGHNWNRLCRRYGESWEGLFSVPAPKRLLALSPAEFASCGIEQKRMIPIKEAAFRIQSYFPPETSLEDIGRTVLACRGVGVWTEQYVRGHFLADADAVPLGDYALPKTVSYFFEQNAKGTDDDMLRLLEPYRGHRFRILNWLEWADAGPPRRGARLPHGSML